MPMPATGWSQFCKNPVVTGSGILAAFWLGATTARAAPPAAECHGSGQAALGITYLHGIDPVEPTDQERGNRELLRRLAAKYSFDLAIVRSTTPCAAPGREGSLCWPRETAAVAAATLAAVETAAKTCFPKASATGLVGFSNGGYLLNAAAATCATTGAAWFLAVGAAGDFGAGSPVAADLCRGAYPAKVRLLIGRRDISLRQARTTTRQLAALGRDVALTEFDGAHELAEAPLSRLLKELGATANAAGARTAAAGAAAGAGADAGIKDDCDLPGHDLRSAPAPDAPACRDQCRAAADCQAFVHISGWNRCLQKSRAGKPVKVVMSSGFRGEAAAAIEMTAGTDSTGKDLRRVPRVKDAAACAAACLAEPQCLSVTYIGGYADCWLKKTAGKALPKVFRCGDR